MQPGSPRDICLLQIHSWAECQPFLPQLSSPAEIFSYQTSFCPFWLSDSAVSLPFITAVPVSAKSGPRVLILTNSFWSSMSYMKTGLSQERCELWSCLHQSGYLERCSTIWNFHCRALCSQCVISNQVSYICLTINVSTHCCISALSTTFCSWQILIGIWPFLLIEKQKQTPN